MGINHFFLKHVNKLALGITLQLALCHFDGFADQQIMVEENALQYNVETPLNAEASFIFQNQIYFRSGANYFNSESKSGVANAFGLHLLLQGRKSGWRSEANIKAFYSANEDVNYFNPKETYLSKSDRGESWYIGRKLWNWSASDRMWDMGYWQPRFQWNKLRPEQQGLTGVFYSVKKQKIAHTLFFSPLFLPDTNPQFKKDKDKLYSKNPWFRNPPDKVSVDGVITQLSTRLNEPDYSTILLQPSFAYQYFYENKKHWTLISLAYKPLNQILSGFPYDFTIGAIDGGETRLELNVRSEYHKIATLEVGRKLQRMSQSISYTFDSPSQEQLSDDWIYQRLEDSHWVTWNIEYNLNSLSSFFRRGYFSASYLSGGDAKDGGKKANETTKFEKKFTHSKALKLGVETANIQRGSMFMNMALEGVFDLDQNAGCLKTNLNIAMSKSWRARLFFDFIGVFGANQVNNSDGFYRLYRANDNISMEMTYVY